jgi:hypothetical protein
MNFEPDDDALVRERALEYLKRLDGAARAGEIASAVGSKANYTRRECNDLTDEGHLAKHYGDRIIGYPMPDGDLMVLPNSKPRLLQIVKEYEAYLPFDRSGVEDLSGPNLRSLLESELAVGDPCQLNSRKVYFSYDGDAATA